MADLTTQDINIVRTQNHAYSFHVNGLKPNTKHKMYVDGVDNTWATKQHGKDFGDDLISNGDGALSVQLLAQWAYPRNQNFELPEQQSVAFQTNNVGQGSTQASTKRVNNYVIIEIKSDDSLSYAQFQLKLNLILTAGPVKDVYPI